ncbi:MAG: acyltransferase [Candidatus Omnitrophota bacterium]
MKKKKITYFRHPEALVETTQIGDGTRIWAFAHLMKGARVGRDCNIGDHAFIESGAVVGNNVTVKNGVVIWDKVIIEDGVFLGPNMVFTNDLFPRSGARDNPLVATLVKKGASIGANATIVCGVTIGEGALVGAGAVVTRDVAPYALVYGNPAKVHGHLCACAGRLKFATGKARCACGKRYIKKDGVVRAFTI